ncbi:MAG TPA: LysE family transporter [Actinomycetota bacterium]|nr:LysE family transporter [Actinomycetota bacterium]
MASDLTHPAAAFGLGIALGASPGPVQILVFSEAARGGATRGLRAMAGANATFCFMLVLLAAGLSSIEPGQTFISVVRVIGGGFLVFLAIDALRESRRRRRVKPAPGGLHPAVRGIVAVLLNPGAYVFLATTGTAVVADAAQDGGRGLAFLTVAALLAGVSLMDSSMVLLGTGAHRVRERALRILSDVLALALGALGLWLIVQGVAG